MKNPILLPNPDDVRQFVGVTWRTGMFRQAQNQTGSFVNHYVEKFATMPRIFYTMSHPMETAHFSTYWNAIPLRSMNLKQDGIWYQNGYIHDLYIMHEIVHAALLDARYDPTISFENWYWMMTENEFKASLATEVLIYFDMPDLRENTFGHAIWVDRHLNGNRRDSLFREWKNDPDSVYHSMYRERLNAMRDPHPFDWLELQMASYVKSNQEFANIWRTSFRAVEKAMMKFTNEVAANQNRMIPLENHLRWIESVSEGSIPFRPLAEKFHENYVRTKTEYGNMVLEKDPALTIC